jgi:hypothetical protein
LKYRVIIEPPAFSAPQEASQLDFRVAVPANWVGRLVAVDHHGNVHEPDRTSMTSLRDAAGDGWRGEMTTFNRLARSHIKESRFFLL